MSQLITSVGPVLEAAWSRESSADPEGWSPENRAWGQCAVTALVVQDMFGGALLRGTVGETSHYFNYIDDHEVDLTRYQFPAGSIVEGVEGRLRSYVLSNESTVLRYNLLWACLYHGRKYV